MQPLADSTAAALEFIVPYLPEPDAWIVSPPEQGG